MMALKKSQRGPILVIQAEMGWLLPVDPTQVPGKR